MKTAPAGKNQSALLVPVILIIALGFAVYGNTMQGKFVWDDEYLIKFNGYIRSFSHLQKLFITDIGAGSGRWFGFYRPVQMSTYSVNYALGQLDERWYHLTNIILHILAALCVMWLVQALFKDIFTALITSVFFLVHPVQTAAVAYISGRADPLAVSFMLVAFILYIRNIDKEDAFVYVAMMLSFAAALLSKELSLILPVLILLYHYSFRKKIKALYILPVIALALFYILLRLTALRYTLALGTPAQVQTTLLQRLPGFFVAMMEYLRLLILPVDLHMEYGNKLLPLADWRVATGAIILAGLIALAVKYRKKSIVIFGIGFFLIALAPMSNIYPINAYMAEHWLYLPSIGLFLLVSSGISYLYKKKDVGIFALAGTALLAAFWSYLTIQQNAYWKDPITFYKRTLQYSPSSIRALNDLGRIYEASGNVKDAMALYEKAIETEPNFPLPYNNLAVLYHNIGNDEKAVPLYEKALKLDPNYGDALNNLAVTYNAMGKNEEAIKLYKRAIKANPSFAGAYSNLGSVYTTLGRNDEAVAALRKAIEIDPRFADGYYNLGLLYSKLGNNDEAFVQYRKAVAVNPRHGASHINLAVLYYYNRQYGLAIQHCDEAVRLGIKVKPDFLEELKNYR